MKAALSSIRESSSPENEFLNDVLQGLSDRQKNIPCKYLYDEQGSQLFEKICNLEDYYLMRTETEIFNTYLVDIGREIGAEALLVEPGAGNCEKVEALLNVLEKPSGYYPIDISPEILRQAEKRISQSVSNIPIWTEVGDFTQSKVWDNLTQIPSKKRVVFFPGSTIGNFEPKKAGQLLELFAANLNEGDGLLIGVDLVKDSVVLERAYHDSEHITERFTKNILSRINSELDGDFDSSLFAHRAFYHQLRQRIEIHLVSLKEQSVSISGRQIEFFEGETIHTENSHKYELRGFNSLLLDGGFKPVRQWTDSSESYAIYYAQAI
ncbi:L-histidine N(alpha)-methyltransferase [Microbulbifer sp. OS29]|uniref:L-histidine N(Alpha)-methyltransferase n=1 Tax=Microbulbifer okhotskensis TaxID=2926617 RepID=A0A9X2EMK0_9GAMM|nr:L-histidine N(alpha)-methyltransferase [Microbulbifer okhotskensis]MCO1334345.1 L-histidine N(alpha)-methyltransferase [Microbulbifer okhotskensis]